MKKSTTCAIFRSGILVYTYFPWYSSSAVLAWAVPPSTGIGLQLSFSKDNSVYLFSIPLWTAYRKVSLIRAVTYGNWSLSWNSGILSLPTTRSTSSCAFFNTSGNINIATIMKYNINTSHWYHWKKRKHVRVKTLKVPAVVSIPAPNGLETEYASCKSVITTFPSSLFAKACDVRQSWHVPFLERARTSLSK